ncbi:semaphorin-1A-like [Anneissia japonica]|uniref:semaphorin-1A-like n=1 Tax=Anneissia japonica TaxID=1529436 RepID=UPI0014258B58|nr:semaphorin-1A-like [Anneissia japonica]
MNDNKIFVCGSNALYPRCYYLNYNISDNNEWVITGMEDTFECNRWDKAYHSGVDFTPFTWNSEMVHEFSDDKLFTGGSARVERDYIICRIPFDGEGYPSINRICTLPESEFLNKANFVGKPVKRGDYTYFFFREFAEEYINHGKIIYSRVGRICNTDEGGTSDSFNGKLISFIKARLDCSIGGDYDPFFFNEIRDMYQSSKDPDIVYAVFTTPELSLQQSAVCWFDLSSIQDKMDTVMFRGQKTIKDLWLAETISPRPGLCSAPIPASSYDRYWKYNLIHPLIENGHAVDNTPTPLFIMQNVVYTSIVVEDKLIGKPVYIIGTDNGAIFMAYKSESQQQIFHKIDLSNEGLDEVTDLRVHYTGNNTNAYVYGTTNGQVFGFQLVNCMRYVHGKCASNPYCEWNTDNMLCSSIFQTEEESPDVEIVLKDYEDFTSQVNCANDNVVLKFMQNSPRTCLKKSDGTCRFYLVATVKKGTDKPSWEMNDNGNDVDVAVSEVSGSLFTRVYYTVTVTVKTSADYTFGLELTSCSLQFQVQLDDSDDVRYDLKFLNGIKEFDEDAEKYRYCLYRWPQENSDIVCQGRILRQTKDGKMFFPRSNSDVCSFFKE